MVAIGFDPNTYNLFANGAVRGTNTSSAPAVSASPYSPAGEYVQAAALSSGGVALNPQQTKALEAVVAKNVDNANGVTNPFASGAEISYPVLPVEQQEEIIKFGTTREALAHQYQPESESAVAYNNSIAANAYSSSISNDADKHNLVFMS